MTGLFQDEFRVSSTRLPGWNYADPGMYFVTICTKEMAFYFGNIENGKVVLSEMGKIAHDNWLGIPSHHSNVILDAFVIMPNHVHGIIILDEIPNNEHTVETLHATSLRAVTEESNSAFFSQISPKKGSLSTIIRSFKSSTTRMINQLQNTSFAWQPRFYEHIIRSETDLLNLREYIRLNPENWRNNYLQSEPSEAFIHA